MIKNIDLDCILMDNNEVLFCGRLITKLSPEEIKKYVKIKNED